MGLLRDTRRRRDPWVGRALKFLIDRAAGRGDASGPEPVRTDPAVFGAFQVWSSGDHGLRRELEARVLAGQAAWEIAARLGLAADVVVAYERLYFDARDRLGAADYIMSVVIGHALHDGFATGDIDADMKVFAFGYGPVVLDAVIEVLGVGDAAGGSPAVAVDRDLARSVRLAIAARSIPVTERTAPGLVRLNARLGEIGRQAAAGVALGGPIRATIEPFPRPGLGDQDRPMTPVQARGFGAAIGHDPGPAGPGVRAGYAAEIPEPGRIRPGRPIRRRA